MTVYQKKVLLTLFFLLIFSIHNLNAQATKGFKETILTQTRSEIILNGTWDFKPLETNILKENNEGWGLIQVPGAWTTDDLWWTSLPGIKKNGSGELWKKDLKNLSQALYRQSVNIPNSWKGRKVELELEQVSTDAIVYINAHEAGNINWYSGKVDITKYIKYGQENKLQILILASADKGKIAKLMGTAQDQVSFSDAKLNTRGITGNVKLTSFPNQTSIADIFVKTSVRKKEIAAEVELLNIEEASIIQLDATIFDENGIIAKQFTQRLNSKNAKTQIINISSPWSNPKLWDLDQPNLYKLKVSLKIKGKLIDEYVQEFGFREFWIEGRNFFLNGSRINLRPFLGVPGEGMNDLIAYGIDGIRKNGFNFSELWPNNFDVRGYLQNNMEIVSVADKKGFLLSGIALPFSNYILDNTWSYQWDRPKVKHMWEKRMFEELKKQRNHPSIILWGTTANFFGHSQDQNPLNIGMTNWVKTNDFWKRNAEAGIDAVKTIKKYDSTRPVFTHHGAYVGDLHTLNFYLDLIPLQEREEWLSHYAKEGEIPFMAIEFGTPFYCTFLRGRNGYGEAIQTEPLATEFAAMYLGSNAYFSETANYRQLIKNSYLGGQKYKHMGDPVVMERLPAFQAVQHLFSKNTWRSWRTWEIAGGMIPWSKGHGWIPTVKANDSIAMPPFKVNKLDKYFEHGKKGTINYLQPPAWDILPGGKAIAENNSETLAYIAGDSSSFTSKNHHFKTGELVNKQLAFFNDSRAVQNCSWKTKVLVDGLDYYQTSGNEEIKAGEKKMYPIRFLLPKTLDLPKTDAKIVLEAKIGKSILRDTFNFRIFKPILSKLQQVYIFDPEGKTTEMLKDGGFETVPWDGKSSVRILVIGRNAMLPKYKMGFNLEKFVHNGGKVLVMNQHPDSVSAKKGFRTSAYISRYVFPIKSNNNLFDGLDELDFKNWTGTSKQIEAYPNYMTFKGSDQIDYHGWHWGNNGGVATGAIEKPHLSAWRPLMECEFDMAWSPLMELPFGKGHLIWNSLDLEDHYKEDIVANLMATRLLNYLDTLKVMPRSSKTVLMGTAEDATLADDLGLVYVKSEQVSKQTDLLLVGSISPLQERQVLKFAKKGGKVLVLPRGDTKPILGVNYKLASNFAGGYHIPNWDISAGLSVSDTRYRADTSSVVINGGCTIAVDGLLGRRTVGKGHIVFAQFDPNHFDADSLTYFRYTRWRSSRTLSQIAANLGATFIMDNAFFNFQETPQYSVALEGNWKAQMITPLPAAQSVPEKHVDPGISTKALALMKELADESGMMEIPSNIEFEKTVKEWGNLDGEMVYRKVIDVPKSMVGKGLLANLSVIDDFDEVYFNGELIGKTGIEKEPVWSYKRVYNIPAKLVKPGKNVIAIRVFDTYGGGGLVPSAQKREIVTKEVFKVPSLYHPDYINDFELGDDPFRFFRW